MLDGISQSLVNIASKVGKGDFDKEITFDEQSGKFTVNRNADHVGRGDHNYFQNETPTELGRQNAEIRNAIALALQDFLTDGGIAVGESQKKALDEIFTTLFGASDATGNFGKDMEIYRPITARTVKQLVTKAQKAHAQAALEALPNGKAKIAAAESSSPNSAPTPPSTGRRTPSRRWWRSSRSTSPSAARSSRRRRL